MHLCVSEPSLLRSSTAVGLASEANRGTMGPLPHPIALYVRRAEAERNRSKFWNLLEFAIRLCSNEAAFRFYVREEQNSEVEAKFRISFRATRFKSIVDLLVPCSLGEACGSYQLSAGGRCPPGAFVRNSSFMNQPS